MIERVLIVLAAAAVGVLALVWVHSVQLQNDAQSVAERPAAQVSPQQAAKAVSLFQRARADNPDTRPIVLEAGLLERRGEHRRAIALLTPVVGKEPDNLDAWVVLAIAARPVDPTLATRAIQRARALNPLAARAR